MLFSSVVFIYLFIPAVIFIYYGVLRNWRKAQNVFLCIVSLFFYAWGEPKGIFLMLLSIVLNYVSGLLVDRYNREDNRDYRKAVMIISVIINVSILYIFKYLNFTVNGIINSFFNAGIKIKDIALPIGISFFTFQSMSYVIDVYRGQGQVQKNIINVGLYISFFPQLIAGPIVRYQTVADEIKNRKETAEDFFKGFRRFVIGLSKKVLLSNPFALIVDRCFPVPNSVLGAWLGAICYTMQIYYDFSGYSDMAIGLGRMFGFHFRENFNYPYISTSITEFWRRWHISLGSWFRDYVYFPLGGSRVSKGRLVFNLLVVWSLTGIWHGANWTFILWGLLYYVLLVIEKLTGFYKTDRKSVKVLLWIYTMLFVIVGWVLFRASSVSEAVNYLSVMFGKSGSFVDGVFLINLKQVIVYLIIGIIFSTPVTLSFRKRFKQSLALDLAHAVLLLSMLVLSVASIVSSQYNPFIYFNF